MLKLQYKVGNAMNDKLIEELANLEMEEKSVKRGLDRYYTSKEYRERLFAKLEKIKKDKEYVKFKLRLNKEMKNENNN